MRLPRTDPGMGLWAQQLSASNELATVARYRCGNDCKRFIGESFVNTCIRQLDDEMRLGSALQFRREDNG
jgi:hypothetical protein